MDKKQKIKNMLCLMDEVSKQKILLNPQALKSLSEDIPDLGILQFKQLYYDLYMKGKTNG